MSNDYFNNPDTITTGQYARSRVVNAILDAIETGFSLLPSQATMTGRVSDYGGSSGAADAYTATLPAPAPTAYAAGMSVRMIAVATNTGAATINVNGLGVKDIRRPNGDALDPGDIVAGQVYTLHYNGTHFRADLPEAGPAGTVSAAGDGSVSAPGISWSLDGDTGLYRDGSGTTKVASDGAHVLTLLAASQAVAEAGADNVQVMTPLRVAQRITAIIADQSTAEAGASNTALMTPLRAEQHAEDWHARTKGHVWLGGLTTFGYPGAITLSTASMDVNDLSATPIFIGEAGVTVDDIQLAVTAVSGGADVIRLGIYSDSSGYPGTLLDDSGTVTATTTAVKVIAGLAQALSPGWYWLAACANGDATAGAVATSVRLFGERGYQATIAAAVEGDRKDVSVGDDDCCIMKPDGTRLYAFSSGVITEWSLSTPYDVTTATTTGTTVDLDALADAAGQGWAGAISNGSIAFKPDGTVIAAVANGSYVIMFELGTAWDLSTAGYTSNDRFDTSQAGLRSVGFNSDGSKMFVGYNGGVAAPATQTVRRYSLGTAYDVTTASYDSVSATYYGGGGAITLLNSDTRIALGDKVYDLGGANDITSKTLVCQLPASTGQTTDQCIMGYLNGAWFTLNNSGFLTEYALTEANIYANEGLPSTFPAGASAMSVPFNIEVAV